MGTLIVLRELEDHFVTEHGVTREQLAHFRRLCKSHGVSYVRFLRCNDAILHTNQP